MSINIGTAGWALPASVRDRFPASGSALERYAGVFPVAEINSSFHRPHRAATWERWRDSTPDDFRFSAKVPKEISHQRKLQDCGESLSAFLSEVAGLKEKLAVILLQLPPKLEFDQALAERFFADLAAGTSAMIACEPRNPSWFKADAEALLRRLKVARVAADPAVVPAAARPGGWDGVSYWRLHGSPHMYRSSYADAIDHYADALREREQRTGDVWCIFDNTASSAATSDALLLVDRLRSEHPAPGQERQ